MSRKLPSFPLPGPRMLLAAGGACAMFATPATAIELGDIDVESALGQPLRASIAFALGPNEQVSDQCVYLNAGASAGLPAVTRARTAIRGNRIVLRGVTPLDEPMMSLSLSVDCPYTARLRREFLLMLNPPLVASEAPVPPARIEQAATPPQATRRPVNVFEPATRPARRAARAESPPIPAGSRYRVQPGDTLSEIVSRIEDRELALWPAVDAIFAANPQAFVGGSADRIIAGATLDIPGSMGARVDAAAVEAPEAAVPARAYAGAREGIRERAVEIPRVEFVDLAPAGTAIEEPAEPAVAAVPAEIEIPAEIAPGGAAEPPPAVTDTQARPEPVIDIADTRIEQARPEPIPLADAADTNPAQSWLVWLGGSGVAIFLALLLFGRRLRERLGGADPYSVDDDLAETQVNEELYNRRRSDRGEPAREPEIDLDPADSSAGIGMDTGDDMDVALDYSFAASGEYSEELDFVVGEDEPDAGASEAKTRIMPPRKAELDEETGTYDMSIVVDVTKEDFGGDRKPRDLEAIEVETLDSRPRKGPALDLTTEFDYAILEQDYEEELTATQALKLDIEKAARELQRDLGELDEDRSQISMAEDLDGTAEVKAPVLTDDRPAENETLSDLDDTDVNAAITAKMPDSDATSELLDADTVEMYDADATVERPRNESAARRKKTG